ncbi:MAG TPA: DUF222 domain-containing protein [Acidimicrobiales bacterium]|nr:DUF222 domain-containing protein [Acidimicrobiales bacterium]
MFDTEALTDMGRDIAGVDVRACSDAELEGAVIGFAALRSFNDLAEAHALAELDARGATDRAHGMRTTSWVAAATGCARGPITGRLRVGRSLRNHFDRVDDAVCDGRLSFDHAKTLSDVDNPRITDILTGAQDEIIALAEASTFPQWKRDVIALAEHADADGVEPDPYADNELRFAKTLDGRTELSGSFDAANGLAFRTALNSKTDELFKKFNRERELSPDLEVPSRKVLRALALAELLRIAVGAEPGSGVAPRAEVTLVVHNNETCDPDGTPMRQAAADVWGCDPEVWAVMVNEMGIPVDVGYTKRLATIAQRRAIAVRDGGCIFPGCDAPIDWCDHHHVLDWHRGGPTDLSNLVALCRHHHGVTHRNGWSMILDGDQIPHWTSPSGDHFIGQRHHRRQPDRPSESTLDGLRSRGFDGYARRNASPGSKSSPAATSIYDTTPDEKPRRC